MKAITLSTTVVLLLTAAAASADEPVVELKKAQGVDAVEGNCGACHSLDYVQMNSPIQDKEGWTKTVGKMVKVMGAPITDTDQAAIIDYLAANYGK
jgi:mono/diheme cytochrome c family protein